MDPLDVQYYQDRRLNWQPYEGNPTSIVGKPRSFTETTQYLDDNALRVNLSAVTKQESHA